MSSYCQYRHSQSSPVFQNGRYNGKRSVTRFTNITKVSCVFILENTSSWNWKDKDLKHILQIPSSSECMESNPLERSFRDFTNELSIAVFELSRPTRNWYQLRKCPARQHDLAEERDWLCQLLSFLRMWAKGPTQKWRCKQMPDRSR